MPLGSSSAAPVITSGPSCSTERTTARSAFLPARVSRASATRVICLETVAQALGGELAGGVAGQPERVGNRGTEQRITERVEHQRQCAFRDALLVVPDGELRDQPADR